MIYTLLNLYIFIYCIVFLNILILNIKYIPTNIIFKTPLNIYIILLKKYIKISNIIFLNYFMFTGLPPVFFFVIKVNIIFILFNKLNFINFIIVFILFFNNMIFYLQILNNKNYKYNTENYILKYLNFFKKKNDFKKKDFFFLILNIIIIFILLNFMFFFDFFIIFSLYS